jgi:hypothetical protein
MKSNIAYACVIVVLIVVIAQCSCLKYENFVEGTWVGGQDFLDSSNLRDFMLVIEPRNTCGKSPGYLMIVDMNGDFISNQPITIDISSSWTSGLKSVASYTNDAYTFCKFNIAGSDVSDTSIPNKTMATVSMINGFMCIKDTEKIYAVLHKDTASF